MNTILLPGCTPVPLAAYLKALGIMRILSQQCPEAHAKGFWRENNFVFLSDLNREPIVEFFLNHYAPSPIVAPWNGGSGFFPKDNSVALQTIAASSSATFATYRETIAAAQAALTSFGLIEKPEKEAKEALLLRCRNTFAEPALEWLDSAFVLTDDGAKYPPLLGTGGNDGRLEFTNNFMQRLTEVFDLEKGGPAPNSSALLANALFDIPIKGLSDKPIGQFNPAASGGANASTGFDSRSAINPWDFILALEGTLLFAAAAVKRLESIAPGQLVYPFCVHSSGAGYGSSAQGDEVDARCEIWMPLWSSPSRLDEVRALFSEGRAWVGRRAAKNGVDFARAIASLGVDRGIDEFQRFGFHVRNGLAYFATPLQRLRVQRDLVTSELLSACDGWLLRFLPKAKADTAPGSIRSAATRLEQAIFARAAAAQAENPDTAQELLLALGDCERSLAGCSKRWLDESYLSPLPPLARSWVTAIDDGTREYRLAAALASVSAWFKKDFFPIRRYLEPVKVIPGEKAWSAWDDDAKNEVVWSNGSVVSLLCDIMKRRLLQAKASGMDSWPEFAKVTAWPSDIAAFIEGRIDEHRFAELLWGLSLVDYSGDATAANLPHPPADRRFGEVPPAFYAQLKLCFAGRLPEDKQIPVEPVIFNLAASGEGARASRQALRRLHGSNIPIMHIEIPLSGGAARRCAAALLFPLWDSQLAQVCAAIAPDFFPQPTNTNQ
jgi:CRISPR-associated protein Csx17